MPAFRITPVAPKALAIVLLSAAALAASNRSGHLTGIAHVALRVSNLAAAQKFYELMGFERAFEFTSGGAPSEEFLKINDRQFIELYPLGKPGQPLGLMHVCFESDDLAAVHQAYIAGQVNATEIKRGGAGNDLFSLAGPDNSVIEFTQYQPGSMHMKDRWLHLGEHRISDRLAGVMEPVSDPGAAVAFYRDQLGLPPTDPGSRVVRLQSDAQIRVGFVPAAEPARLVFVVASLPQTESALRRLGVEFSPGTTGPIVKDPDGNEVLFTDRP